MNNSSDKLYSVYIHTSPKGKKYIGITSMQPPEKRWANGHGYAHNYHFTNAINYYGWNNFLHEIIATNLSQHDAIEMEKKLILKYNTMDQQYGYNQTSGGEVDKVYSDEVRAKIREAAIQSCQDPARRTMLSEQAKRQWEDKEFKEKMRQKIIAQWECEEFRESISERAKLATGDKNPFYGKQHTEATKEVLRQKNLGKIISEDSRKKMSDSHKKQWENEEYRKKITEATKGKNNPHYGKKHSKEAKDRIGELNGIPIVQLDRDDTIIAEYRSAKMAEEITGINQVSIRKCCNNKQQTAGGFKWKNKNDQNKL